MLGLDVIAVSGMLMLAGETVQCRVPEPPQIVIDPITKPIEYDYDHTSAQLDQFKNNTVSPYAPGTDTTTGGLRHDRPVMHTEVEWGVSRDESRQIACLWYRKITITIELSPKIYVAKSNKGIHCLDAIKEHELKHVKTDRSVINRYAQDIGQAVKQAVDGVGAMGPYNYSDLDDVQAKLVDHIKAAVDSKSFLMFQDMRTQQAKVDSLQEYERVSKICEEN